ncbi:MAG: preprotein translocase subunit YajC [Clostridia bacterium]|nr:preprotein translocase subunit YajC [Clostridia bacterium]
MLKSLLIANTQIFTYVILAVLVVAIVVMFFFSSRKRKKQEKDAQDLINAVKPGNKVKTIGGICGIVVEVDNEENTFVLETGTEQSGKCFIKFDRQAIYQTDAVVEHATEKVEEAPATEVKTEEVKAEETAAPVEEAPVEEKTEAEKPKKKTAKKTEQEKQVKF